MEGVIRYALCDQQIDEMPVHISLFTVREVLRKPCVPSTGRRVPGLLFFEGSRSEIRPQFRSSEKRHGIKYRANL